MPSLAALVEIALLVSALAHAGLLIYAFRVQDGVVWNVFRLQIATGLLSSMAAGLATHMIGLSGYADLDDRLAVVLGYVILFRLLNAWFNIMMAMHLRRLLIDGVAKGEVHD